MCDYSLMSIPNRLAVEGEDVVTYRFHSGSIGFASESDVRRMAGSKCAGSGCRRGATLRIHP